MNIKNYYKILNVKTNAAKADIKKAYRELVLFWHPDINSNPKAHDKVVEINEAYEILYDDIKRTTYDKLYSKFFCDVPNTVEVEIYKNNKTEQTDGIKSNSSKTEKSDLGIEIELEKLDEWVRQSKVRAIKIIKEGFKFVDRSLEGFFSIADYLFWGFIGLVMLIVLIITNK
jgi:curved DNA-binding protein CbpA